MPALAGSDLRGSAFASQQLDPGTQRHEEGPKRNKKNEEIDFLFFVILAGASLGRFRP
jgi:hypothetical protein